MKSTAPLIAVPRPCGPPADADQHQVPLLEAVRTAVEATSVRAHAPAHNGGRTAHPDVRQVIGAQVFRADVWLQTDRYDLARRSAERLAAQAWGARRAWLLGGGSSAGNLAWCVGMLREGQDVIVARDAHTSVLNGLILSGARPRWVAPRVHPTLGIPLGVEPADLHRMFQQFPDARQVILSSPGYCGTCTDVGACIEVAHVHDATVYVDQAWGAHLNFHPDLPDDALRAGADGAVVSLHKGGSGLSSGAVLLAGPGADLERLDVAVRATQTTSPLLPLLVSVDAARRDLAVDGRQRLGGMIAASRWLSEQLRQVAGLSVAGPDELGLPARLLDPGKTVIDVAGLGYSGWQVEEILREGGTAVEGADARRVYVMVGSGRPAMNTATGILSDLRDLSVLSSTYRGRGRREGSRPPQDAAAVAGIGDVLALVGEAVLTPRQAQQAQAVAVPAQDAIGRVAAESVLPYPPGVPVVVPGERITARLVELLQAVQAFGGHLRGCADPSLATLRVTAP